MTNDAGPVSITLNTIPPSFAQKLVVFRDNLAHTVIPHHTSNNRYVSGEAAPADIFRFRGSP